MQRLPAAGSRRASIAGDLGRSELNQLHDAGSAGQADTRRSRSFELGGARAGFSNAHLIAAIAIFIVITLLLQLQSGAINPLSLVPTKAPAAGAKAAKGKRAKGIEMLPGTPSPVPAPGRPSVVPLPLRREPREESIDAFACMGSEEAAALLVELGPDTSAEILAQLEERDIARILEVAPAADAAKWVKLLLEMRTPPELPEGVLPPGLPAPAAEPASPGTAAPADGSSSPASPASPAPATGNPPGAGGLSARDPRRPRSNLV